MQSCCLPGACAMWQAGSGSKSPIMGSLCPLWYAALSLPVALSILHLCQENGAFIMHSRDVSQFKAEFSAGHRLQEAL